VISSSQGATFLRGPSAEQRSSNPRLLPPSDGGIQKGRHASDMSPQTRSPTGPSSTVCGCRWCSWACSPLLCVSMEQLVKLGPACGYYPEPSKRVLIVEVNNVAATECFAHLGFKIATGYHCLGGYAGPDQDLHKWLKDKALQRGGGSTRQEQVPPSSLRRTARG
jgi:hypothetical protein